VKDRVLVRYLLAREQLAPVLNHVERLAKQEKWAEAIHALDDLKRKLGFVIYGDTFHINSEWIHNLGREDKERVVGFAQVLRNISEALSLAEDGRPREVMWLEAQFRLAREDMPWIYEKMRDDTDAVRVDNFTVFLTEGVTDAAGPIETLKKAAALIHPKFPKVLYGKVYVREGINGTTAGGYVAATDTINLSMYVRPNRNSVDTLVHEFGHRLEARFLSHEKRQEFKQLYEIGDLKPVAFPFSVRKKAAEAMVSRWKKQRDDQNYDWESLPEEDRAWLDVYPTERWKHYVIPLQKQFQGGDDSVEQELVRAVGRLGESGDVVVSTEKYPQPLYASDYGSTNWQENFAESFLHFITHRPLPEGLQRFMESL
jgi:hypothetical protein